MGGQHTPQAHVAATKRVALNHFHFVQHEYWECFPSLGQSKKRCAIKHSVVSIFILMLQSMTKIESFPRDPIFGGMVKEIIKWRDPFFEETFGPNPLAANGWSYILIIGDHHILREVRATPLHRSLLFQISKGLMPSQAFQMLLQTKELAILIGTGATIREGKPKFFNIFSQRGALEKYNVEEKL